MRPRLDCRGEPPVPSCSHSRRQPTSMRPRLDCRGEPAIGGPFPCRRGEDFNAATARLPWRSVSRLPLWRGSLNFNSATARLPWRTDIRQEAAEQLFNTSMRPRLDCRGESTSSTSSASSSTYFNAATARLPWRTSAAAMGTVSSTGDFNAATARLPWRMRSAGKLCCRLQGTSMRPRLDCRGELRWRILKRGGGGDFNAATARLPWRTWPALPR